MKLKNLTLAIATALVAFSGTASAAADKGKVELDMRLRYENVSQDNSLKDADALILRTFLGYKTATYKNLSGYVQFEDTREMGVNDYNDTNGNGSGYSVIADPETTELDQAYLQYKLDNFSAKVGRQVITMDTHRFVGDVGWRQDRQTFNAANFEYTKDKLSMKYAFINKRNRIFGEEKDVDSKDHLINVSYKTDAGKLTAYSYILEVDNDTHNSLDTFGLRFAGGQKLDGGKLLYTAEFAKQSSETATTDYDASYTLVELGYAMKGGMTFKGSYELLGSDDASYAFSTPLATLHKFNGWADQFLGTPKEGLADMYFTVAGKAMGGKWSATYHNFEADDATNAVDDLGSEIDVAYTRKFTKHFSGGIKYAAYNAGDIKVDTDKLWIWVGAKF